MDDAIMGLALALQRDILEYEYQQMLKKDFTRKVLIEKFKK